MLKRLYVHNYKCLVNFEFKMDEDEYYKHTALLIGKNGAGKSSVAEVLQIFQQIGRQQGNLDEIQTETHTLPPLVIPDHFSFGVSDQPMRFEIDVELDGRLCHYALVLELPPKFQCLRVKQEQLVVAGKICFSRDLADVRFSDKQQKPYTKDWHEIYLPEFIDKAKDSNGDVVAQFKNWLRRMLILSPVPRTLRASLNAKSLYLKLDASNIVDWWAGLNDRNPDAYADVKSSFLRKVFPDFLGLRNEPDEYGVQYLTLLFENGAAKTSIRLDRLSDGEKCLLLAAFVLAANATDGPLLCFWDEPDNFLAISEVEYFVAILKKHFLRSGQIIMTTHNPETLNRFAEDNTYILRRETHLSPTRPPQTITQWRKSDSFEGDFVRAWTLGDVEA